jgi:hypothetical protein
VRLARRSLALRPAHSRRHLYVTCYTEGFSHFVTSMTAPVASGWSVRRMGLAPTGKRRLLTAHANSSHSPAAWRTGQIDPKRAFPVSPGTDAKRQRAALSKQLDMRLPERLCTVVDENEMKVIGRQAIGSRPPDGACGVGSPGDSDNLRRRPRRRTTSRQISLGYFRPRNSPSAAAIREQK